MPVGVLAASAAGRVGKEYRNQYATESRNVSSSTRAMLKHPYAGREVPAGTSSQAKGGCSCDGGIDCWVAPLVGASVKHASNSVTSPVGPNGLAGLSVMCLP